jgi:hypothetical protein
MRKTILRAWIIAVGIATVAGTTSVEPVWGIPPRPPCEDALDVTQFNKLHGELTSAREAWQSIPWHLSILDARAEAAREKKPVYMLCRAGHPLGCV